MSFRELWLLNQDGALSAKRAVDSAVPELREQMTLQMIFNHLFTAFTGVGESDKALLDGEFIHIINGGKPHVTVAKLRAETRRRLGES